MTTPAPSLSLQESARPLLDFYQRGGVAPPELLPIDGAAMPEAKGDFAGFIGPRNLLRLVENTAPWIFQAGGPLPARGSSGTSPTEAWIILCCE